MLAEKKKETRASLSYCKIQRLKNSECTIVYLHPKKSLVGIAV